MSFGGNITRQLEYWKGLYDSNKDVVIMGDANLDALKWNNSDYNPNLKLLSNALQEHLLEETSFQIVQSHTRSEIRRGVVINSCIDHIYTNAAQKCSPVVVSGIGDSDHLGVSVTKFAKEAINLPKTILKRNYKSFNAEYFLYDILYCGIN